MVFWFAIADWKVKTTNYFVLLKLFLLAGYHMGARTIASPFILRI